VIWSSVLLIAAALVLLVTGVLASSLELTYISIGVSLLAAIVLSIGVILRRDDLFRTAGTARQGGATDWPAADVTGVRTMVGGRTARGRAGRDNGDLASVPRPGTPTGAEAGPRRGGGRGATGPVKAGPGKAGPGAARTGEHPAGRGAGGGRPARSPPARREPVSWEGRDAPPPRPPGFRVPPFGERPAMPAAEEPGRGSPVRRPGDGRHDPVRPAWPATAGPRAMGTGPAKQALPEPTDGGPEPPLPPGGFRLAEPAVPEQEPATESPEREQDWGEQAAAESRAGRGLFEPFVTSTPRPDDGERAEDIWQAGAGEAGEAVEVPGPSAGEAGALAAEEGDVGEAEDVADDADGAGEVAELAAAGARPLAGDPGERPGEPGKPGADEADGSAATPLDGEVTLVPGITRYHRRRCILIRFLSDEDLETMTRGAAEAGGSMPCKACQPDKAVSD
jgi:hypothetical protein